MALTHNGKPVDTKATGDERAAIVNELAQAMLANTFDAFSLLGQTSKQDERDLLVAVARRQMELATEQAAASARGNGGPRNLFTEAECTNIKPRLDGTVLTLQIDLARTFDESESGKSRICASTHGNRVIVLPDGAKVYIGVNAYQKTGK